MVIMGVFTSAWSPRPVSRGDFGASLSVRRRGVPALAVALGVIGVIFLTLNAACPVFAVQPDEVLKDTVLEARARDLSRELRCMVCQNQSIDDSEAPLARDLRILVRERLTAGDSDTQVLDFLVARYGEFVLLKPRFEWHTAVLWLTPIGVLIAGVLAMYAALRRRRVAAPVLPPLSPDEEKQLTEMIG
jgi:cytochrome c-type biogenesis protein CcmH